MAITLSDATQKLIESRMKEFGCDNAAESRVVSDARRTETAKALPLTVR